MQQKLTLKNKYNMIKEKFGENVIIYFNDIQELFANKKKATLYWDLSKLVDAGYMIRLRNGVYKLSKFKSDTNPIISSTAKKILDIMNETGFNFYISGIDVLAKYLHHIPESYPVMLFAEKAAKDEIFKILTNKQLFVVTSANSLVNNEYTNLIELRQTVILNETESFTYSENNLATKEKAFIDLFFEVTRNGYPLALQELARIYQNIVRNGAIDRKKMVKTAYVRNMQYDIRFIAESKFITDSAIRFASLLKETDGK